jgi:hypothetical protein
VICDTYDFGIGGRLCAQNWSALRAVGESANQRLSAAQAPDARPAPDVVTFNQITRPSAPDGLYAPGIRFGDPPAMAVLASLVHFQHLITGFTNADFVPLAGKFLGAPYTTRQATYDFRRLKRKGLIARLGNTRRYQVTPLGRRVGVLFIKAFDRVLAPGLTDLHPALPEAIASRSPLACAWRRFDRELTSFITNNLIAA